MEKLEDFICNYVNQNDFIGEAYAIEADCPYNAALFLVSTHPASASFVSVRNIKDNNESRYDVLSLDLALSDLKDKGAQINARFDDKIRRQTEEAQRQAQEAQRQDEIIVIRGLIEDFKNSRLKAWKHIQLEMVIDNYLQFPELDETTTDTEVYSLREELYVLSFWQVNLQTVIQNRIISDKLDALQAAITGVANTQVGIANDQAKRHRTSILGQAATVAALGKIAQDTEGVGDFFGD